MAGRSALSLVESGLLTVPLIRDRALERRERLERLIADEYRLVWRLLRRFGVPASGVDDATQQVFLVIAERLDEIRPESERAFAFGTALRVAQGMRRRAAREDGTLDLDQRRAHGPSPDELADQRRACARLDRILDQLPDELRSVFVLFELEGMTSPEIAALTGLALGTVASRLRRARAQFRGIVAAETTASRSGQS
jgi:RNA polymerase sigma-70 factor, ECF subfamily